MKAKLAFAGIVIVALAGMGGIYMALDSGSQSTTSNGDSGDTIVNNPSSGEVKDATLTINALDTAGDGSESVSDVAATVWKASSSDAYGTRLQTNSDIGGLTVSSGLSTNSQYTIVETDDSYYTADTGRADGEDTSQPFKSISIDSTQPVAEYHVKSVVSESDMSISAFDSRNNALTTGDTGQEDFELALDAGDEEELAVEFENGADSKVYHLKGLAYKPLNAVDEINDVSVTGPDGQSVSVSQSTVPEHMQTSIHMNETDGQQSDSVSDYQTLLEFDEVVEMEGNDKVIVNFDVAADDDTEPSAVETGDLTQTDALIMQFKDADHYTTPDLTSGYGIHDESSDQSDVGLDESDSSPLGAQTGFILEAK